LPHSVTLHAAVWLPLAVLAVERLFEPQSRRWVGVIGSPGLLLPGEATRSRHLHLVLLRSTRSSASRRPTGVLESA
jgi:hypothetical protein